MTVKEFAKEVSFTKCWIRKFETFLDCVAGPEIHQFLSLREVSIFNLFNFLSLYKPKGARKRKIHYFSHFIIWRGGFPASQASPSWSWRRRWQGWSASRGRSTRGDTLGSSYHCKERRISGERDWPRYFRTIKDLFISSIQLSWSWTFFNLFAAYFLSWLAFAVIWYLIGSLHGNTLSCE